MPDNAELIDSFGRHITYVRMSVTDRCDLRCRYCMAERMTFMPRGEILSLEEIVTLADVFIGRAPCSTLRSTANCVAVSW